MNDDIGSLIEPVPVQFSLGAPGWYVLGTIVAILILVASVLLYRHYKRNLYRRDALAFLTMQQTNLENDSIRLLYEASILLKRIVMARYGRQHASITGTAWVNFLNSVCKAPPFDEQDGTWISTVVYSSGSDVTTESVHAYLEKTRKWIKLHRYAL